MSMDTFRTAVAVAADYDSMIAIGGGEPTLHPDLLAMLGIASFLSSEPVFMVTNGTCPEKLWRTLVDAKRRDRLSLHVSRSPWHNKALVKPWVWDDAAKFNLWWGQMDRGRLERSS
jgi:MoaA/NifB/PqqE/SkfB family radical SAM enzyme